jgi:rubrerythrin
MKIKTIVRQNRRDFRAVYECEHCEYEHEGTGYDDYHFHEKVIPDMRCPRCDKTAPDSYRPLATKYPDGQSV